MEDEMPGEAVGWAEECEKDDVSSDENKTSKPKDESTKGRKKTYVNEPSDSVFRLRKVVLSTAKK